MDMETREGNDVRMEDCETLLASIVTNCKRRVTDDDPSLTEQETEKAFAVGKTRVYFRSGGVEMLEKELAKTRNRCASIIQGTVRGFLVRTTVEGRQLNRRTRLGTCRLSNMRSLRYPDTFVQVLLRIVDPHRPMISQ